MTIDDLNHIFKKQIESGETKLYFMLIDGETKLVERHPVKELENLVPMLDCFIYSGDDVMPRFVK